MLLEHNNMWSPEVNKYLPSIIENYSRCEATAEPKPSIKVSLSFLSFEFNIVVCVDHLHLCELQVFHIMDLITWYVVGAVVDSIAISEAFTSFESQWVSLFRYPQTVLFDLSFQNDEFTNYLSSCDVDWRPIPPRRHKKKILELKNKTIGGVFIRISSDYEQDGHYLRRLIQMAFRISSALYGNDVMSASGHAKEYTRPVQPDLFRAKIPVNLVSAYVTLLANHKRNFILRFKYTQDTPVHPAGLVQIYIKNRHEKCGSWTGAKPVLTFDVIFQTGTVPSSKGRTIKAAFENVRHGIFKD